MVAIVEGVVGVATVRLGILAHQQRRTMDASAWRRRRWGSRQRLVALEFPVGFLPSRDHRAPFGTT
jgi:hypothetical protein